MAGGNDKFCLKWNDFENNVSTAFQELREDRDFFDVTLACEGNQLEAHKVGWMDVCFLIYETEQILPGNSLGMFTVLSRRAEAEPTQPPSALPAGHQV